MCTCDTRVSSVHSSIHPACSPARRQGAIANNSMHPYWFLGPGAGRRGRVPHRPKIGNRNGC